MYTDTAYLLTVKFQRPPKRAIIAPIQPYNKDNDGRPDNICQGCSQPKAICICGVYCAGCKRVKSKCTCN